jgi:hypothetical protein
MFKVLFIVLLPYCIFRFTEQRARAQQGQKSWLLGVGVSRFKAFEVSHFQIRPNLFNCSEQANRQTIVQVWLHSDANTLPPCSNEKLNEEMDGALDDLSACKGEWGSSIICKNCTHWLQ